MIDKSRFLVYHPQDQAYQAEWRVETFLVFPYGYGVRFRARQRPDIIEATAPTYEQALNDVVRAVEEKAR